MHDLTEYSSSRLATLHTCLRKYKYKYVDRLIDPGTDAQAYGKGVHAGLEAWLLAHDQGPEARLAIAHARIIEANLSPVDAIKAHAVIDGYELRWGGVAWRVLAAEIGFRYELGGHVLMGVIDGIIQDETDGRIYVVEHKNTVSDIAPGTGYWDMLTIDRQVSIYVDGAAMLGYEIAGVIYDAIGKPKHDRLLATPEENRKYTKGKGCKLCGGTHGGKGGIKRGEGCATCNQTGWFEEPRLHEDQRAEDESPEAFDARVRAAIASAPEKFYQRATIVRTDDELPKMRIDLLETIRLARMCEVLDMWPRGNTHACRSFGTACAFIPLCTGSADITDETRFPRRTAQP